MISRDGHLQALEKALARAPVVAMLGARQVGKTTLARQLVRGLRGVASTHFDLDDPRDLAALAEPTLVLSSKRGLVVLDEIQRRPELFAVLRVLADRPRGARFLVLGSASPALLRQSSESLAGRSAFHPVGGLSLPEVGAPRAARLWLRGGFPRSFTARSEAVSVAWRRDFIATFLERDLGQFGIGIPAATLGRFWSMLAHYHAQRWNSSELARAFGVSHHTVRGYLDALTATFMVRQLPAWHENLAKRQVKAPKVYLADSGILHALLGIGTAADLERHPKVGASWEGFCLEAVTAHLRARPEECFYWATQAGAELDLLVVAGRRRLGFEFKRTDSPRLSPSMRAAVSDLRLDSLVVVHGGDQSFAMAPKVRAVALTRLLEEVAPLGRR